MKRIIRIVLIFLTVTVLAVIGAVCALYYWVNEDLVVHAIERMSQNSLQAEARISGKVTVERLPSLRITLPAIDFVKEDKSIAGHIDGGTLDVSLWGIFLGAVRVESASFTGVKTNITLPELTGDALFDATFGSVNFPPELRVKTLSVTRSSILLNVTVDAHNKVYQLSDMSLTMGALSPEMSAPFDFTTRFTDVTDKVAPKAERESETPVITGEKASDLTTEMKAEEKTGTQPSEEPKSETAAPAPESGAQTAAPEQTAEQTAEEATEKSEQESPETAAEPATHPAVETTAEESDPNAAQQASEPPQSSKPAQTETQSAPAQENAPAASESVSEQNAPAEGSPEKNNHVSALLNYFISTAEAREPIRATELFTSFSRAGLSGAFSAKGTLTISTAHRHVMFDDTQAVLETSIDDTPVITTLRADRLRFRGKELSGININASITCPTASSGDIHLGAVDFRLRSDLIESPEARLSVTHKEGERTVTFDVHSSVKADLRGEKISLENFDSKVTVEGDATLPSNFVASLGGFVNVYPKQNRADAGLSGSFAGAPFTFNGKVSELNNPQVRGELMIGAIDTATTPRMQSLDWMNQVDYDGELRIGRIVSGPFVATQLNGTLKVKDGLLMLDSLIVNYADGRIHGTAHCNTQEAWNFTGRLEGLSLDKAIEGFGGTPRVSGVAGGLLSVSGTGLELSSVSGRSELRVLRGMYSGVSASEVRERIVTGKTPASPAVNPATAMDETTATLALENGTLSVSNLVARSANLRTQADFAVSLADNTISGTTKSVFAPAHGVPSVVVDAALSGPAAAPLWGFGWDTAVAALQRAQGKTLVEDKKSDSKSDGKSLWQTVKDFFKF